MSKSHGPLSRSCLHYLLLPDIDRPIRQRPVGDSPANDKYPFLAYAADYWPLHYASQEADAADQSRQSARMLCNTAGHSASIWVPRYFGQRVMQRNGWTDLALASYLGLKPVVENIVREEKTHVDVLGGDFGTALQAASARGHKEIVQMLLDQGADVDIKGGGYVTALRAASVGGHKEIVQMLLDKGADVGMQGGVYGMALQAA